MAGDAVALGLRPRQLGAQVGDEAHVEVRVAVMFGRYWSLMVPAPTTATPMGPARSPHAQAVANACPAASPSNTSLA